MKKFWQVIAVIAILIAVFFSGWLLRPVKKIIPDVHYDTIIRVDTLRDTILIPKMSYFARVDTVFLRMAGDTVRVEVEVPIERKVYQTEDYKATIEGFRPALVDMEIYRQTRFITKTETFTVPDKRRWGLGIQVGYAYTPKGFQPTVGVGVSYNVITW